LIGAVIGEESNDSVVRLLQGLCQAETIEWQRAMRWAGDRDMVQPRSTSRLLGNQPRSVEVVRSNIHFADLQKANDIRLHRDHILLVLKLALD